MEMAEDLSTQRPCRVDDRIRCVRCNIVEWLSEMAYCEECSQIYCRHCCEFAFSIRRLQGNICRSCASPDGPDEQTVQRMKEVVDKIMHEISSFQKKNKMEVMAQSLLPVLFKLKTHLHLDDPSIMKVCEYAGCREILFPHISGIAVHEEECFFGPFYCSKLHDSRCGFKGILEEFVQHFWLDHNGKVENTGYLQNLMKVDPTKSREKTKIINYNNGKRFFILRQRVDDFSQKVFWVVQLLGPSRSAEKYSYKIVLLKKNGEKLSQTKICLNHVWSKDVIFAENRCVVIPFELLYPFFTIFPIVHFELRIKNLQDDDEDWEHATEGRLQ